MVQKSRQECAVHRHRSLRETVRLSGVTLAADSKLAALCSIRANNGAPAHRLQQHRAPTEPGRLLTARASPLACWVIVDAPERCPHRWVTTSVVKEGQQ